MSAKNNRFLVAGGDDLETPCPGCGKPTYPSEKPMLCLGTKWHPGCIKCTTCGITLSPRMMESYEKKPYCRAHRPNASATATTMKNDFHVNQATSVPKAARRQPGVDVTQRQTFYLGSNKPLDSVQKDLHQEKASINPRGFVPERPAAPNRSRAQGVNKLEGTTFNEPSLANKSSGASSTQDDWSSSASHSHDAGSYDQGGDQGGYDQGGYDQGGDQGGYDQGGYDQGGDQGGYDQGGYDQGGDQGGYDQGGYDQGGDQGGYDQGGYDQGGYDQGAEGGYDQGGYDQGAEGGYDQGGYDQGGYDQGGYDQGYDENQGY